MLVATGWSKLTHAGLGQGVDLPYVEQTGRDTSFVFQLEHICSNNDICHFEGAPSNQQMLCQAWKHPGPRPRRFHQQDGFVASGEKQLQHAALQLWVAAFRRTAQSPRRTTTLEEHMGNYFVSSPSASLVCATRACRQKHGSRPGRS